MAAELETKTHSFSLLMQHYGYAPSAVYRIHYETLASPAEAPVFFGRFFDNYYIHFLALQLQRFGFNLYRPCISLDELQHAEGLIQGKHGNPPLDSPALLRILDQAKERMLVVNRAFPLTWDTCFDYTIELDDRTSIRGRDLIHGLLKSDCLHRGAHGDSYFHTIEGRTLGTCTMMQVIADQLERLSPTVLGNVNRFGKPVSEKDIKHARSFIRRFSRLSPLKSGDYYTTNMQERLKASLEAAIDNLAGPCDLQLLHTQRLAIQKDYTNPSLYPRSWQRFLFELDDILQLIAAPYL